MFLRSRTIAGFFSFLLVFGVQVTSFAQTRRQSPFIGDGLVAHVATLIPDKTYYRKNDTAKISGEGFFPFARVDVTASVSNNIIGSWVVYPDLKGQFVTEWFVPADDVQITMKAQEYASLTFAQTSFIVMGKGAQLDQCRNGAAGAPEQCIGGAWANGNLNGSQAAYLEGESVPYRMIFSGLTVGPGHSVTIEWDTTVSQSTHAIDYITSFNRSETDADPCTGTGLCDPLVFDTEPIPTDPNVVAGNDQIPGTTDDIVQIPGEFRLYGGTIDSISTYSMSGDFSGASATSVTVNFTAALPDAVLVWGGHIATRRDWGATHSAVAISGAPFHMRGLSLDGTNIGQDRGLDSGAVVFPAEVDVVLDAQPNTSQVFSYTAVASPPHDFMLDDNGNESDAYRRDYTIAPITLFGTGNEVLVTQQTPNSGYRLDSLTCVSTPAPGLGSGTQTTSVSTGLATLTLNEGETVVCTYVNLAPTAGDASASGGIYDEDGRGLPNIVISATSLVTGDTVSTRSNIFGLFTFSNLKAGEDYILIPKSNRIRFSPDSLLVTLNASREDIVFKTTRR
jgi:hypothetical protein